MDPRDMRGEELRKLYAAALLFAHKIAHDRVLAEEVTQQAFERLLTTSPWNEQKKVPLTVHVLGIVRSRLSLFRKTEARRPEQVGLAEDAALTAGSGGDVFGKTGDGSGKRIVASLRARLEPHALEREILELMMDGITKRAHLVEQTGEPDQKVAAALARIRRYARKIAAEKPGQEDEVTS